MDDRTRSRLHLSSGAAVVPVNRGGNAAPRPARIPRSERADELAALPLVTTFGRRETAVAREKDQTTDRTGAVRVCSGHTGPCR